MVATADMAAAMGAMGVMAAMEVISKTVLIANGSPTITFAELGEEAMEQTTTWTTIFKNFKTM